MDAGVGESRIRTVGTRAWAIDAQAQGTVGKYPLSFYGSVARAAGGGANGDSPNVFTDTPRDRSAQAIAGALGIIPNRGSLVLALRNGDNGEIQRHRDRSVTIGGIYHLHQNVQFQLNYSMRSGDAYSPRPNDGNRLLTLMLAAAM